MRRLHREPNWLIVVLRGERVFWGLFALAALATLVAMVWLLR